VYCKINSRFEGGGECILEVTHEAKHNVHWDQSNDKNLVFWLKKVIYAEKITTTLAFRKMDHFVARGFFKL
jgi:hypothetical protein